MNAVDTNVLVYAADSAEPVKQNQAVELLSRLENDPNQVVLLWQVGVEYLACLRRWESLGHITRDDTLAFLSELESMFECVIPTQSLLGFSLELSSRYSLSHWDSLLIAGCVDAGVTTLYTEDLDAGMTYETVTVVNPFAT